MKRIAIVLILFFLIACNKKIDTSSVVSPKKVEDQTVLPFFNSAEFTPEWIDENSEKYNNIHTIPSFSFINQNSEIITNEDYTGKIYVADFFFTTCPSICPKLTKQMNALQSIYNDDDDVMLLSHSVMPWKDSVDVLKKYAVSNNIIDAKWNLVTGDKDELYTIARQGYFADEDFVKTQDESAFIHSENFILIDKKGRIRGVYNGTLEIETERIVKHIKLLKQEG